MNTLSLSSGANIYATPNPSEGWFFVVRPGNEYQHNYDKLHLCGKSSATSISGMSGNFTKAEGPVMALVDYSAATTTSPNASQFYSSSGGLFENVTTLTDASNLTVNYSVESRSNQQMFAGCTNLTAAPALPAPVMKNNCYNSMFLNCSSLETGPSLSSTTLATSCYDGMFRNCSALKKLGTETNLPAEELKGGCYYQMFQGCTNIEGPITIEGKSPTTDNVGNMFTNAGTSHPMSEYAGTDKVKVTFNNDAGSWPGASGMDGTYWSIPTAYVLLEGNPSSFTSFKFTGGANIETSADTVTWTSLAAGTSKSVSNGKLYVRGKSGSTAVYGFQGSFTKVSGNIMALVDYSNVGSVALNEAQFADTMAGTGLFSNQTTLRDASALELPRTTLTAQCYFKMFIGCSSLTAAPALPATTLASSCYNRMFAECTSLVTPPALPATTLENYSYYYLFQGCSNLEGPIDLSHVTSTPGTNVGYMLQNTGTSHKVSEHPGEECIKMTLPEATQSAWITNAVIDSCYWDVPATSACIILEGPASSFTSFKFVGGANVEVSNNGASWTSLSAGTSYTVVNGHLHVRAKTGSTSLYGFTGSFTKVSGNIMSLVDYSNVDTVALNSYQFTSFNNVQGLFTNVATLIDASGLELPRTTLNDRCYNRMFAGCSALESAPALPATTLAKYCYSAMFLSCSSLTSAPTLPATSLVKSCYNEVFSGCTSLMGPVYIYATSPFYDGSTSACPGMFTNSGTSRPSTPTDYKKIKVGGDASLWNSTNAGISSTYWTVELI